MFQRILIANRGEIACRVMATARRLGIETVAVVSEADRTARHARLADIVIPIGPAPARESYLRADRILDAARQSGAQAIHPGYGFLSENADFAAACSAAGITFIGPPASAIRAMGSKAAARALMEEAGVPVTPGYHGADQDPAHLAQQAARIGYPVLIKATAGGGGKGMRRVDRAADFAAALQSCQREARSAFDDDRVLIERYVLQPRHIEIQVFGDTHGNYVYLFERDCSVQRRHQKVLEEAPAPGMTDVRRAAMGRAAVEAARAVGYVGAGTVEFIAAPDGSFHFMEMNTRLQVEHPVTEAITGQDLVAWQFQVAAGEPLPLRQEDLRITGHALEARIYAEDPDRGFLPSTGQLIHLAPPQGPGVRVDTGVEQGDTITPFYDPMIAKLIVHGTDRADALVRMDRALADWRVVGLENNVRFLRRLVNCHPFVQADLDTALIERAHDELFGHLEPAGPDDTPSAASAVPAASTRPPRALPPEAAWQAAALAMLVRERLAHPPVRSTGSPWDAGSAWRLNRAQPMHSVALAVTPEVRDAALIAQGGCGAPQPGEPEPGPAHSARVAADAARGLLRTVSCTPAEVDQALANTRFDGPTLHLTFRTEGATGRRVEATVVTQGPRLHVYSDHDQAILYPLEPLTWRRSDADASQGSLRAPMPGRIVACLVEVGQVVAQGAPLIVLEAMKMEHTITAPSAGRVAALHHAAGALVSEGAQLVTLDAVGTAEEP